MKYLAYKKSKNETDPGIPHGDLPEAQETTERITRRCYSKYIRVYGF